MVAESTLGFWERKRLNKLSPSERRGTKEYFKLKYWTTLNQRTVNGLHPVHSRRNAKYMQAGIRLELTKEEFGTWVDSQWPAIEAIYMTGGTPSIDRNDNTKHYTLENIQVLELKENMSKDRKKPIVGTFDDGSWVAYSSAVDAERDGYLHSLIGRSVKTGMRHKGARWRLA